MDSKAALKSFGDIHVHVVSPCHMLFWMLILLLMCEVGQYALVSQYLEASLHFDSVKSFLIIYESQADSLILICFLYELVDKWRWSVVEYPPCSLG